MHKRDCREGFTLVELSLSVVFIATLSVAVALVITNSISTYRRGLTLNSVNTVGMEIVDDVRAAVKDSPSRPVSERCASIYSEASFQYDTCVEDNGLGFALVTKDGKVTLKGETITVPLFGAFCTGNYSYIWNSGYYFEGSNATVLDSVGPATFEYKDERGVKKRVSGFKLLKIKDDERSVCVSKRLNQYSHKVCEDNKDMGYMCQDEEVGDVFDITGNRYMVVKEEPVDILAQNSSLVLYDFNVAEPANGQNSVFYSMSFILGTIQGGINVMSVGDYCVAPKDDDNADIEDFNYCAINKFNFAALATGGYQK